MNEEKCDRPVWPEDSNPRPHVIASSQGDPSKLGVHLYERLKEGPKGPVIDIHAVGALAVNTAVRSVIEANSRLARSGLYLVMIPAMKKLVRRDAAYSTTTTTIIALVLKDMD